MGAGRADFAPAEPSPAAGREAPAAGPERSFEELCARESRETPSRPETRERADDGEVGEPSEEAPDAGDPEEKKETAPADDVVAAVVVSSVAAEKLPALAPVASPPSAPGSGLPATFAEPAAPAAGKPAPAASAVLANPAAVVGTSAPAATESKAAPVVAQPAAPGVGDSVVPAQPAANASSPPPTAAPPAGASKPAGAPAAAASTPVAEVPTPPVAATTSAATPALADAPATNAPTLREKSAAGAGGRVPAQAGTAQKIFLATDGSDVKEQKAEAGTGTALTAPTTMSPATLPQPHFANRAQSRLAGAGTRGEGMPAEDAFVTWRGWTNGGGERSSTAAQFSSLSEHSPASHAPFFVNSPGFGAAGRPAGAMAAETAAAQRPFPTDPAALVAPIGAAIDRLALHGRDQLSLTVRFEQGGSLSLKLAMREGEIAAQIQTDVPGLENALRSAWGQLSHDLQGRGLKLANPEFASGGGLSQHEHSSGGRPGDREAATGDTPSWTGASAHARARRATPPAPSHPSANGTHRRSGLQTWA